MPNTNYTKAEFVKHFPDADISSFFKHSDRVTSLSGADFYTHFGIQRQTVRADNAHHYSIPFESASLFAAMIRSFRYAYGSDRRGRKKDDSEIPFTYDRYHDYIRKLSEEIERLEPYQRALVKSFKSYQLAQVADTFIPMITERLSAFLFMIFSIGNGGDLDFFAKVTDYLDHLIESFVDTYPVSLSSQQPSPDSIYQYTFENALRETFCMLAEPCRSVRDESALADPSLVKSILNAKIECDKRKPLFATSPQDTERFRAEVTDTLNNVYAEYTTSHQEVSKVFEENLSKEVAHKNSFWTSLNRLSRFHEEQDRRYHDGLNSTVEMAKRHHLLAKPTDKLKSSIKNMMIRAIDDNDSAALERAYYDMLYLQEYENELTEIEESDPQSEKELKECIEQLVAELHEELQANSIFQESVYQDDSRTYLFNHSKDILDSGKMEPVTRFINDAIAHLIPINLNQISSLHSNPKTPPTP